MSSIKVSGEEKCVETWQLLIVIVIKDCVVCLLAADNEIKSEQAKLAAAIAVPLCLVFILALAAAGAFVFYRKGKVKKQQAEGGDKSSR